MPMTPMRAIRAKCIDCCCGNVYEPTHCTVLSCPLHAYRLGKRPKGYTDTPKDVENDYPPRSPALSDRLEVKTA